jgi:hypothetical protein
VYEHGNIEVAPGERLRNMLQMQADLVARGGVLGVLGGNGDHSPLRLLPEVMCGFRLQEAHTLIAVVRHGVVARGWGAVPAGMALVSFDFAAPGSLARGSLRGLG